MSELRRSFTENSFQKHVHERNLAKYGQVHKQSISLFVTPLC